MEKASPSEPWSLHLFGSRVDDEKKGGDIDLVLVLGAQEEAENAKIKKSTLIAAMKMASFDQRIDLVIASQAEWETGNDPFLRLISRTAIRLGP